MKAPFFHTVQPVAGTAHKCDRTRDPFLVQFLIQSAGQTFIAQAIRHRHHAGQTRIAAILRHCHIVDLCCNGAVLPMRFQTDHMILFQVVQRDLDISPVPSRIVRSVPSPWGSGLPVPAPARICATCSVARPDFWSRLVFIMVALPFSTYLSIRIRWTVGNSTGKKRILGVPPLLTRDRSLADL